MAKTLKDYLLNYEKEYRYRIKTAFPITPMVLEKLEKLLERWSMVSITAPKKLIIQKNPADFNPSITNCEVSYIDTVVKYPASPWLLGQVIRETLNVPDAQIVIKILSDDGEEFMPQRIDLKDYTPLLSDPEYKEAPKVDSKDYYGNEYTSGFIQTLTDLRKKERKDKMQDGPENKVDDSLKDTPKKIDSPLGSFNPKTQFPGGPK